MFPTKNEHSTTTGSALLLLRKFWASWHFWYRSYEGDPKNSITFNIISGLPHVTLVDNKVYMLISKRLKPAFKSGLPTLKKFWKKWNRISGRGERWSQSRYGDQSRLKGENVDPWERKPWKWFEIRSLYDHFGVDVPSKFHWRAIDASTPPCYKSINVDII